MKLLALTLFVCVLGEFIVNIFIFIVTLVIALFVTGMVSIATDPVEMGSSKYG